MTEHIIGNLVYMNEKAAWYLGDDEFHDYISEKIGTEDYLQLGYEMESLPASLSKYYEEDQATFLDGTGYMQYSMVTRWGGTFINAMLWPMAINPKPWITLMNECSDFLYAARYVDVPWEYFSEIQNKHDFARKIDEEEYVTNSALAEQVARNINEHYSKNVGILH